MTILPIFRNIKIAELTVIKVRVVNNGNVGPTVEAEISIIQRKITLTSAKDEKFYDGTALTNDTIVVGGED